MLSSERWYTSLLILHIPHSSSSKRGARMALLDSTVRWYIAAAYATGLQVTGARTPRHAPLLQKASALGEDSSALVLPALSAARGCASNAAGRVPPRARAC